jgi:8-oxo-dGTP pyrophosphatase MutT (NUDIX family)
MPLPDFIRRLRAKIGHDPLFMPGVFAAVFDDAGRVLLGRRADNGKWAPISGIPEPGESPAAAAEREAREEAGVEVVVERVSGVYASPLIEYPNGDVARYVTTALRCRYVSGEPRVSDDESLEVGFFPMDALPPDLRPDHLRMLSDAAEPGADRPARFDR